MTQTTVRTLPNGGYDLFADAIRRVTKTCRGNTEEEWWISFEVAFATEIAKLAETYGLAATLRSLFLYHGEFEIPVLEIPRIPPTLELYLEGEYRDNFPRWHELPAYLERHGLDMNTFCNWNRLTCERLEEDVAAIFGDYVAYDIVRGAPVSIESLAKCQIRLNNEVSFTLPEWEATKILEEKLNEIVAYANMMRQED